MTAECSASTVGLVALIIGPTINVTSATVNVEQSAVNGQPIGLWQRKVVSKELNEAAIWLEIIVKSSVISPENVVAIVAENRELCCIISASIRTCVCN